MFGCNAIKVPFNCIVQDQGDGGIAAVIVVGGSMAARYKFGSKKTHQLIVGDAVIRPHFVVDSDHLIGTGLAGLAKSGFADIAGWLKNGDMLIDAGVRPELTKKA